MATARLPLAARTAARMPTTTSPLPPPLPSLVLLPRPLPASPSSASLPTLTTPPLPPPLVSRLPMEAVALLLAIWSAVPGLKDPVVLCTDTVVTPLLTAVRVASLVLVSTHLLSLRPRPALPPQPLGLVPSKSRVAPVSLLCTLV